MAATSGKMSARSPVSSSSSKPRRAPPSVRMRNQLIANPLRGNLENQVMQALDRVQSLQPQSRKPSRAAKRTARSSRKWSS